MTRIIALLILFLFSIFSTGQTAHYDISLNSKKVGSQVVTQKVANGITTVEIKSKATVSLGFKYTVSYHQIGKYDDQRLIESKVIITKNDEVFSSSHTKWANGYYQVNQDGRKSQIPGELYFATTRLYFTEPEKDHHRIYSEADCTIKILEKTEDHIFKVSEPGSSRGGKYYYHAGVLQKAVVNHLIIDFIVELTSYTP